MNDLLLTICHVSFLDTTIVCNVFSLKTGVVRDMSMKIIKI